MSNIKTISITSNGLGKQLPIPLTKIDYAPLRPQLFAAAIKTSYKDPVLHSNASLYAG